ncbi:calmodulin-binding receptor-like cytoplasmic kinase 1 [Solanum lycopersicum]|uniref:calmodulin-binding receptor-like cytoplasmic kinase 1 n=1 Tax=Solanum lycopersicum TaxID=4081 RepID=UPI000532D947|nr:calmodulin-binding receptor-like cytoplasmic kinase 1 [Solanum lycopersicum]
MKFARLLEMFLLYTRLVKDLRVLAEFKNEVQALSKIEHLNLVRFYGFLELRDERIIITEYVSNGTLREHLDGKMELSLKLPSV